MTAEGPQRLERRRCPRVDGNDVGDDSLAPFRVVGACDAHVDHGRVFQAAMHAYHAGDSERAGQLCEDLRAIWSKAWSANYAVLEFMQSTGLTRFSPVKPQHWVVASFEHHTSPHGLPRPHVHNIVLTSLTTAAS